MHYVRSNINENKFFQKYIIYIKTTGKSLSDEKIIFYKNMLENGNPIHVYIYTNG